MYIALRLNLSFLEAVQSPFSRRDGAGLRSSMKGGDRGGSAEIQQ
jgi:hypothetical protein